LVEREISARVCRVAPNSPAEKASGDFSEKQVVPEFCQAVEVTWRDPGLTERLSTGLPRTGPQVIVGWSDADEVHVPFDMFARGGGASTRKGLIQQYEVRHLVHLRQEPVGKRPTAAAGNLPTQQLDGTVEDPVVVRFDNAILAMVDKPNHARAFDSRPGVADGVATAFILILTRFGGNPGKSQSLFLREIGHPRIRRTEVRPIAKRRAISDLLTPERWSFRT
jgi:hypothetical protein